MKVYRNNRFMVSHVSDLPLFYSGGKWTNQQGNKVAFTPQAHTIIYTGPEFEGITDDEHFDGIIEGNEMVISASTYYIYDGRVQYEGNVWIAVWKEATDAEVAKYEAIPIFNIMKGTYTGKDMGERSITAQIDFPSRIDFQIGDYVKFEIANLMRANGVAGGYGLEKFYIYTKPTIKKVARPQSHGKAFQHTVIFYPCQYELATVKMRDVLQEVASGVIYTGYDEFSFYGGANTLMKRIMAVLNERFPGTGVAGRDYWSYQIADSVNEDLNTALEKFQFDFSDSSVMDALLKLNDAEGINTKFFINERMIYVGYKRPYITGVDANNIQRSVPFEFMYGKTSHLPGSTNYGNLFTLTKTNGSNSPITRLYAYGSDRNLHRFYCSDRIKTGRYVNKLMLPSFEDDGRTDYIDSPEGIAKFGIREGTKTFDNIYPSLRFFYYGNLRDVKYCIKLMGSGLEGDVDGTYDNGTTITKANITPEQIERVKAQVDRYNDGQVEANTQCIITIDGKDYTLTVAQADVLINSGTIKIQNDDPNKIYQYPIARVQCYRVVEQYQKDEQGNYILDGDGNRIPTGQNELIESLPPVDLAVFCHATGKVVKCVLYADTQRQLDEDGRIPTRQDGSVIVGSCFAVHDGHPTLTDKHFECGHTHPALSYPNLPNSNLREAWFTDADTISTSKDGAYYRPYDEYKNAVSIHQIHYTDDHWITDVYEFTDYHQQTFNRQGYSAYCWPRVNKYYPDSQSDNIEVNAVVDVGPVMIEDTDLNISQGQQQQTFDIYLRDVGFKINEQTWFGDKVFLFDTCHINFLDGKLAGYSFEMPAESDQAQLGSIYVPALKPDGSLNSEFFDLADNPTQAYEAYNRGAYWRIVAKRQETEVDRYYVPNVMLNASRGDHVVFLDIFMPDIYVRVAEQRLYKEAKKYLDANDDGDIQYSFDIDKVRPNEQPIFAIQMREGAIMRVVDDDLDVGTVNKENMLFWDKDGLVSAESMLQTNVDVTIDYEVVNRTREDIIGAEIKGNAIGYDDVNKEYYLFFDTLLLDANNEIYFDDGVDVYFDYESSGGGTIKFHIDPDTIIDIEHRGSGATVALHKLRLKNVNFLGIHKDNWLGWDWHVEYSFKQQTITPQTDQSVLPAGVRRYCAANNLTEFKPSKYYEVLIDTMEPDLAVSENGVPCFALVNGLGDGQTIFTPEYTAEIKSANDSPIKSVLYKFTLSDEFDDSKDYYPAILYQSDGETEAVHVRLWSVLERDDEHLGELNYVDLAIDSVTINFNDNTREPGISLQEGQEPERLTTNQTEMVREVTATVKEESRASAWAQLAQRMDAAEMLQEQTLDFYQNLVNQARQHYIQLLNLKNNIFDPDGTCKDTFLQVMMLQVGADSMNYQLKYTHYGMNGQTSNCGVNQGESEQTDPDSGKLYFDSFAIGNAEEVLDHYVYTKDQTGGRWYPIERNAQFPLHKVLQEGQEQESYPTYFIALKASTTDSRDCHWVCEPVQHKVNELDGYYYFNWGILVPVSDDPTDDDYGHYQLTETRGNAYMYGDNLICGQISTLAGNSYFDLTHGNFVLSKNGPDGQGQYHEGLTYINGVLTIYGYATDGDINNVLYELGLVDDKADAAVAAAAAAQQAAEAAQAAVDKVTNDGIISGGTEKQELNREFVIIAGSVRDGEGPDGSYYKNVEQADEYGVDHSALDKAFADLYAAMKIVLGTDANTGKIDGSNIHSDTYIGGLKNNVATYDIEMILGGNRYQGASLFAFNDNGYSTGVTIKKDSKYKLTVAEKSGTSDIDVISDSATFGWLRLTHFGTDEQTETNLVKEFTNTTTGELVLAAGEEGQQVTIDTFTVLEYVKVGPTEFNDLWKNYYDAEVSLLNAIDEASIGGENMIETMGREYESTGTYTGYSYLSIPFRRINNMGGYTAFPIGKYVFSAEKISILRTGGAGIPPTGISVKIVDSTSRSYNTIADVGWGDNVACKFELTTAKPLFLRVSWQSSEECRVYIKDAMLQLGTKQTAYQDYVKHLTDALKGTTEVVGGLLMTNVLMLKDENGAVKAGMSGLTGDANNPENVAMWAGGSYQDALDQLAGIINTLPLLLTKIGIGSKIGCFNVDTANQVSIIGADGTSKFIFNTGDANTGAYMSIEKSGNEVIRVTTDEIHPEYDSLEFGVYGPMTKLLVENSTPKSSVEIDSFTTPSNTTLFRFDRKDAVYVFFSVYVNSPYGSGQEEFNINFKVKFGGATILTVSHTTTRYNYSNIEWFEYLSSKYLTFDQAASTQKLEITDISITSTHGSQVSVTSATLKSFIFGYAKDSSRTVQYPNNWQSAQGLVYRRGIVAHTIIGRNGMAVVGADGTTINFLNENGSLVFRAIGLPNKKKSVRQVINSQNDLSRLKAEFESAGSSWNSWTASDRLQFFNDVAALIPNEMPALSIQ